MVLRWDRGTSPKKESSRCLVRISWSCRLAGFSRCPFQDHLAIPIAHLPGFRRDAFIICWPSFVVNSGSSGPRISLSRAYFPLAEDSRCPGLSDSGGIGRVLRSRVFPGGRIVLIIHNPTSVCFEMPPSQAKHTHMLRTMSSSRTHTIFPQDQGSRTACVHVPE
jgi:hypothetical protein